MKEIIVILLFGMVLMAGCTEQAEPVKQTTPPQQKEVEEPETQEEEPEEETPPAQQEPEETEDYTSTAYSQEDCATMAPNCGDCISKRGCGWCKDSNTCLLGTSEGPSTGQCKEDEWTVTSQGCSVVDEGESCSELTNCVACLSGTGCNWCIQGSVCAPVGTSEDCFGGWLDESYQCNYASR